MLTAFDSSTTIAVASKELSAYVSTMTLYKKFSQNKKLLITGTVNATVSVKGAVRNGVHVVANFTVPDVLIKTDMINNSTVSTMVATVGKHRYTYINVYNPDDVALSLKLADIAIGYNMNSVFTIEARTTKEQLSKMHEVILQPTQSAVLGPIYFYPDVEQGSRMYDGGIFIRSNMSLLHYVELAGYATTPTVVYTDTL
jgi:hypothetical protein